VEVVEENEKTLQEATRLAKDRKTYRIWLMEPYPIPERATME
jgi:hypothetical protein